MELAYNLFFHSPVGAQFTHFEYLFHHYIIVFIFFPLQCKRITIILFLHWNVDLKGWFAYFSLVLQIKFSKISVHIDNKREREVIFVAVFSNITTILIFKKSIPQVEQFKSKSFWSRYIQLEFTNRIYLDRRDTQVSSMVS